MKPNRGIDKTKAPAINAEGSRSHAATIGDLKKLLNSQLLPQPKGPPKPGDEEARQVFFVNLVRLKEQRLTNAECAERLGVSERSISTYLSEPLYAETRAMMVGDAKENGRMLLSEVIPYAVAKLFELLNDKSGFVQFKAAETILAFSGYNLPHEEAQTDSRDGVAQFLREVDEKRRMHTTVNVQINQVDGRVQDTVVESIPSEIPAISSRYEDHVLPGGKLPSSFGGPSQTPLEKRKGE